MAGAEHLTRRGLLASGLAAAALRPSMGRAAESSFAVKNATLLDHTGRRLPDHGLRVEGGVITALGPSSGIGEAVDLGGDWLVPGLTDAGCQLGLLEIGLEKGTHDDAEGTAAVVPDARVRDGYNPRSELIGIARVNGITSVLVHPSTGCLISGQAALFRTVGDTVNDALIQAPAALCFNLGHAASNGNNGAPASRMGVAMKLREILGGVKLPEDAEQEEEGGKKAKKKKSDGEPKGGGDVKPDDQLNPADLTLRELKRGRIPALFYADRADDLLLALDLARSFQLHAILLGASEGHLVAKQIADAGVPVFLGPATAQPDSFDHRFACYENAARLHAAGVQLSLRTGSAHQVRNLPYEAGVAVAHGLPFEAAIRALTVGPWEALGIAGRGRLEVGADASFFATSGDPLQPRSAVHSVWISGVQTSMVTRQSRLYDAFRVLR